MNKEEVFAAWAPEDSLWSRWTKPVLFAHLDSLEDASQPVVAGEANWCPAPAEKCVVVVDLPGAEGVLWGVALAKRDYRPVPLYNALPYVDPVFGPPSGQPAAAVDMLPIMEALRKGAESLVSLQIASDAPPAFLLDANRHGNGRIMKAASFDNRSVCFTTDFPSANLLLAYGFQRALLVQRSRLDPLPDLAHALRRWQDGGIVLERMQFDPLRPVERFEVARPSWYGLMFQRALLALGLRRAPGGGFGAWMPESSAIG